MEEEGGQTEDVMFTEAKKAGMGGGGRRRSDEGVRGQGLAKD